MNTENLQKHLFNTGVRPENAGPDMPHAEWRGTRCIAFYTDPLPGKCELAFLKDIIMPEDNGYIIREVKGGGMLSKYAFFSIDSFQVNGYTIRYNPVFNKWQLSHPEIGFCGHSTNIEHVIEDAKKG